MGFWFRRMKCCHGVEDVYASACVCMFWDSSDLWVPNGDCAALEIHIDTSVVKQKRFLASLMLWFGQQCRAGVCGCTESCCCSRVSTDDVTPHY